MHLSQLDFNAGIVGLGVYLPEKRATEQDFINAGVPKEKLDEWGVYEHRVSEPDETPSNMSVKAAESLIKTTGIDLREIDLIIDCALVSDCIAPSNSHKIQYKIGATNAASFDIIPSGGGVTPALVVANSLVLQGIYKNILLTCSSKFTSAIDKDDLSTVVVCGDGAAATLISKVSQGNGFLASHIITRGEFHSQCGIKAKASPNLNSEGLIYKKNEGELAFFLHDDLSKDNESESKFKEFMFNSIPQSSQTALKKVNLTYGDVNFWIMHQNIKQFSNYVIDKLGIRDKGNYYYSYSKYGNIYSANVLINLFEAVQQSLIKDSDIVVLAGTIAGLSTGAVVMRWGK